MLVGKFGGSTPHEKNKKKEKKEKPLTIELDKQNLDTSSKPLRLDRKTP